MIKPGINEKKNSKDFSIKGMEDNELKKLKKFGL
jgi:hypothetical protein